MPTRALLFTVLFTAPLAARADDLMVLLEQRKCRQCQLADVDLVHANLRDADLGNAKLMRANLSQAQLDGANLSGADLSFTSLRGASLRGANLTGSRLYGTDLREADLSGAQLSPKALEEAHWQRAKGIANGTRSHALLHKAGVEAFQAGRWHEAEQLFGAAIDIGRNEPLSWVARGISRSEQAKDVLAAADFRYAADIYRTQGADEWATQLTVAANEVQKRRFESKAPREGQGIGGQLLEGGITAVRVLAHIAARALTPLGLGF